MSQSLKLLVTLDRMVSALVCEDHMLQGYWLWPSEKTKLGEEILRIYQTIFEEWNAEDKGRWEAIHWGSSDYDINITKKGEPAYPTSIKVKWIGRVLFLWFYGSLLNIKPAANDEKSVQFQASQFTSLQNDDEKKRVLSGLLEHTPQKSTTSEVK